MRLVQRHLDTGQPAGTVAERAVVMARDGVVPAVDGSIATVTPRSLCVHSDTPGAVAIARAVRTSLAAAGIDLEAFA